MRAILSLLLLLSVILPMSNSILCAKLVTDAGLAESSSGEDGYRLWLRYEAVNDLALADSFRHFCAAIHLPGSDPTLVIARAELESGLKGLLGAVYFTDDPSHANALLVGTPVSNPAIEALNLPLDGLGRDGYLIKEVKKGDGSVVVIAAKQPLGVLYGSFAFLRQLQTLRPLKGIQIRSVPSTQYRILDHWDNPAGNVERGYAGGSLWKWKELPGTIDPRYADYARACSSIGINVAVLNNVNASPENLSSEYLEKTAVLAQTLRPYGIRVALTPLFDLPMRLGKLDTANPQDPRVIHWWKDKTEEIYRLIPDFAGFLIKADSEGRPGPHAYGLTHDFGANMLGGLLAPHGGIVMWRAFSVEAPASFIGKYYPQPPSKNDYCSNAFRTFSPLDGRFHENVALQVKTGPRDFQPREVPNPLFGAMRKTSTFIEMQITQEYLGESIHLCYLAPMWREVLDFETHAKGNGSTIAKIIEGKVFENPLTGAAGVANTGSDRNWTGHHFAQANWYAFGRLAWDVNLSPEAIAEEWTRMTFGNDPQVVSTIVSMMMGSWEAQVNYTGALGLMQLVDRKHYGPDPAFRQMFHNASATCIGIDRTATGLDFVSEYEPAVRDLFANPKTCPEKYLLFFHQVSWDEKLSDGRTVWEELAFRYCKGVEYVDQMQRQWKSLEGRIDPRRFNDVTNKLNQQRADAAIWRDVCLKFFSEKNARPIPTEATPSPASAADVKHRTGYQPTLSPYQASNRVPLL